MRPFPNVEEGSGTRPNAGIETLEDLAGRKVMWDTKAGGVFYWAAKHVLDCYDLHDEIVSIPSPSPMDRAEALKAGRVDAYACSTQFRAMEILQSSVGMKMLDIPSDCADQIQAKYPLVYASICPRGYNGGMVGRDVSVLAASTALQSACRCRWRGWCSVNGARFREKRLTLSLP